MADMLVKLYTLPDPQEVLEQQRQAGIIIRRALAAEKILVISWIQTHFGSHWASEGEVSFARLPISTFIALENQQILGFACHDASYKNFFGPTGILEARRGYGIGKALLVACLHAMREQGYAYAIIGGVGPAEFYAKVVGAELIADSTPGIYRGLLQQNIA